MSVEGVQKIMARAIVDGAYRQLLLDHPDQALAGFDLTGEETAALKALKGEELDGAATDLEDRLSKSAALTGRLYDPRRPLV